MIFIELRHIKFADISYYHRTLLASTRLAAKHAPPARQPSITQRATRAGQDISRTPLHSAPLFN